VSILSIFLAPLAGQPTGGSSGLLGVLSGLVGPLIGCTVAFVVIFWLSLVIWTFRDIRSRTQDFVSQVLATVLVAVFFVGGLFIYMILRPRQTLAEIYERQLEEESLLAEMTERQTCNNCHARVESDFQICPSCGQKLKRSCPKCERLLELRWTFCPYCATNIGGAPVPSMPGMPNMAAMQGIPPGSVAGMPMGGPVPGNRY
jgi:RNA polymerase subunit RPABC4/transcription elongation factor Spt4